VVVDCEGDPADIEQSKLVFRGAEKPVPVPDAVPDGLTDTADTTTGTDE
jgi:ATP-dependent Clp protease ATP-binding subunit ClpC